MSIQFSADGSSYFDVLTSTVMLSMDTESNRFFHEMFHAYQAYGETMATWNSTNLNREIEARYAQYLYLRSLPEYSQPPWSKYTEQDPVWRAVKDLSGVLDAKGNLRQGVTEARFKEELLNGPVYQLKNDNYYKGVYGNYLFDANKSAPQNFKNLKTLSGGC